MSILRILTPLALIALLAFLLSRIDLDALQSAFSQVSAVHVISGLALVQVQIVVSALRWRFTAARLGGSFPVSLAIREYYVASFLNQSLPGGVAGDAIRAFRMRSAGPGGWKAPAKAVLFERLSGQMAFFLLAVVGLFIWPLLLGKENEGRQAFHLVLGSFFIAAVIAVCIFVARRRLTWVTRMMGDVTDVFLRDRALLVQSGTSLLIVSTYVATFLIASDAVGAPLPWEAALTIVPLCLIAMLIPAGFGGWGTREAAAMALWPIMGASAAEGLAASIIYGGLSLAGALPGLALLSLEAIKARPRRA